MVIQPARTSAGGARHDPVKITQNESPETRAGSDRCGTATTVTGLLTSWPHLAHLRYMRCGLVPRPLPASAGTRCEGMALPSLSFLEPWDGNSQFDPPWHVLRFLLDGIKIRLREL